VRRADAEATDCGRLPISARGAALEAGFGYEFLERADGFAGLAKVYAMTFSQPPTAWTWTHVPRAGRPAVDVIPELDRRQIAALDLVALSDDRGYFRRTRRPGCPAATLEKYPAVAAALAELAADIRRGDATAERIGDVEHKDITDIARAWLASESPKEASDGRSRGVVVVRGGAQGLCRRSRRRHHLVADEPVGAGGATADLVLTISSCRPRCLHVHDHCALCANEKCARDRRYPPDHSRIYARDCATAWSDDTCSIESIPGFSSRGADDGAGAQADGVAQQVSCIEPMSRSTFGGDGALTT